jgi:hypothetical protein
MCAQAPLATVSLFRLSTKWPNAGLPGRIAGTGPLLTFDTSLRWDALYSTISVVRRLHLLLGASLYKIAHSDTVDEAVRMLARVIALDRQAVRRRFEERFSATRVATDYVALYRSLPERPSMSEHARRPCRRHDRYWKKS